MKSVGIFTTFVDFNPQYSLTSIVRDQINMLLKHGYKPVLFVVTGCKDLESLPKEVEVRAVVPQVPLTDYQLGIPKQSTWEGQVDTITSALIDHFKDFDIIITHDIVFQTWFLVFNQAIRNIAEKYPNIKWLHWSHSAPRPFSDLFSPNTAYKLEYPHTLRFSPMANSTYVGMNYADIELVAQQFNVPMGKVQVVYNCRDIYKFFDMHPFSIKLIEKYGLMDTDILMIYPTRLSTGKNIDMAAELVVQLQKLHKNAKLVICNSYSNAQQEKNYANQLKNRSPSGIIITSMEGKEWEIGVPYQVIKDLMCISNVFFLPSKSEGCSLILLEAALTKNLIILNNLLPSLHEFGEQDAIYIDCDTVRGGKSINVNYHPTREAHMEEKAKLVIEKLDNNPSLNMFTRVRKKFNPEWIYKNQLEPLLEG